MTDLTTPQPINNQDRPTTDPQQPNARHPLISMDKNSTDPAPDSSRGRLLNRCFEESAAQQAKSIDSQNLSKLQAEISSMDI